MRARPEKKVASEPIARSFRCGAWPPHGGGPDPPRVGLHRTGIPRSGSCSCQTTYAKLSAPLRYMEAISVVATPCMSTHFCAKWREMSRERREVGKSAIFVRRVSPSRSEIPNRLDHGPARRNPFSAIAMVASIWPVLSEGMCPRDPRYRGSPRRRIRPPGQSGESPGADQMQGSAAPPSSPRRTPDKGKSEGHPDLRRDPRSPRSPRARGFDRAGANVVRGRQHAVRSEYVPEPQQRGLVGPLGHVRRRSHGRIHVAIGADGRLVREFLGARGHTFTLGTLGVGSPSL